MVKVEDVCSANIIKTLIEWDYSWWGYEYLSEEVGFSVKQCKKSMKQLKDSGYVIHSPTVNSECIPSGSGFFLTGKHLKLR